MFSKLSRWLSRASDSISLWQFISGSSLIASFALPAWAAATTEWVMGYGPIGWVAAGFAGLFVSAFSIYIITAIRFLLTKAHVLKTFYANSDKINPLDLHFLNKRINLKDLLPPGPGIVENKTFENCELVGPLNIFPFQCLLQRNLYTAVDFIVVDNQKAKTHAITNAAEFRNCRFLNCKIYFVSFLVMEDAYKIFDSYGGCNWITKTPEHAPSVSSETEIALH